MQNDVFLDSFLLLVVAEEEEEVLAVVLGRACGRNTPVGTMSREPSGEKERRRKEEGTLESANRLIPTPPRFFLLALPGSDVVLAVSASGVLALCQSKPDDSSFSLGLAYILMVTWPLGASLTIVFSR